MKTINEIWDIRPGIFLTTGPEASRLLDKQFQARLKLRKNPVAWAMNMKLQIFFRNRVTVL